MRRENDRVGVGGKDQNAHQAKRLPYHCLYLPRVLLPAGCWVLGAGCSLLLLLLLGACAAARY